MGKDNLKHYLTQYGEVKLLNDLAVVFQELGAEWLTAGNKSLGYTLTDAAITLANVGNQLQTAELAFIKEQGLESSIDNQRKRYQLEFDRLMREFESISDKDITALFFLANKDEWVAKLKRIEWLKKQLATPDKSEK
jgi:hypothetical protein